METDNLERELGASECEKSQVVSESIKIANALGGYGMNTQDIPISRESPDGSSDGYECPATSPRSHSSLLTKDSSSRPRQLSSKAKVLRDKNIGNITGARPKEIFPVQKLRNELLDVSDDNSGPDNTISPSLLEVNYEKDGTCDDSYHSALSSSRIQESQVFRVPQARHRSSNKIMPAVIDSDQDSDDTVEESHPQSLRRRRKLPSLQQLSPLSVKSLVDSRGVLQYDTDHHIRKEKYETDFLKQCNVCENTKDHSHKSQEATGPGVVSQELERDYSTAVTNNSSEKTAGGLPQVSAPVPVTPSGEVADGIALSAPASTMKQYSSSSKNTAKKKKTHGRSRSDGAQEVVRKFQFTHSNTDPNFDNTGSSSKLDAHKEHSARIIPGQERKRFMEDGGHSITPAADNGFFPRPRPGQSLIEFLSSKEFHKQHASLDKENAHFNISEAVIAALTQMQFNAWHQKYSSDPGIAEDSDEEIRSLQAQIQEKRRKKLTNAVGSPPPFIATNTTTVTATDVTTWVCASPPKPGTADGRANESPPSSCHNSESDLGSGKENQESDDWEDTPTELSESSIKSEEISFKSDLTSAENVAINLLKNFNEHRLPKASELEWLVSEEEVPQKLLPLPTSIAVSPEDAAMNTLPQPQLRGTSDWAPPRPQLVLTLLTPTKRSVMMKTQGWRCAGCGMKVSEHLSRHFRFCNYLGRYFCTTCHSNRTAIIPARVIYKWDFKSYPVSNFSLELTESMKCDPLFNVGALNCGLYKKCRHLQQIRIYRLQLYHALPYINTCSRANPERKMMENRPQHWASDPHAYSLEDLISAKNGSLVGEVKKITKICINHIAKCQVCAGRGFICEICGEGEPIFPFQLDSTALCMTCGACYHVGCFCPLRCPRCIRRETRHLSEGDPQKLS